MLFFLIWVLPWIAVPGVANPYREPKELALMAGLWAVVLWGLWKRPLLSDAPRNPWTVWVSLFLVGMGLWHFFVPYLLRGPTQQQVIYNVYAWLPTVNVVVALLAARMLSMELGAARVAQLITQWWCGSAALTGVYALFQAVGLDQWYVQDVGHGYHQWGVITGSFGNPEYLALYVAMLFPLVLLFRPKRYLAIGAVLVGVLWLTHIPGCWLIAAIGLVAYGIAQWWHDGKLARLICCVVLIACAIAGAVLVSRMAQQDERLRLWSAAWTLVSKTSESGAHRVVPSWTGRGLGATAMIWSKSNDVWVHNEYLQGLVEIGLIGLVVIGLMLAHTTRTAWRRARESLLDAGWFGVWVAFLAASVVFPCAHWAHTAWVGLCAMAMIEREDRVYVQ